MLTKNVKLSLLVGLGVVSFNLGWDVGLWLNEQLQDKYTYYINELEIDADKDYRHHRTERQNPSISPTHKHR